MRMWLVAGVLALATPLAWADCADLFASGKQPVIDDDALTQRTTLVCYEDYALDASGITKGPLWSAEHLTAAQMAGADETARTGSFHDEKNIPAADRSELADYKGSGYDRGHMTPAGDAENAEAERQTFSLANVVPQTPQLNRGVWERIETQVRGLATALGDIYVVTGPAFESDAPDTIGEDAVAVPTSTWKAVYEPGVGAGAYLCSNTASPRCEVVSIDALDRRTGVDPFPAIAAGQKASPINLPQPW